MGRTAATKRIALADALDGRQRVRAMLMAKGHTIASWARSHDIEHDEQVHQMLSSKRAYPEIRDLLATDLGMTRKQFDDVIPMPSAVAA